MSPQLSPPVTSAHERALQRLSAARLYVCTDRRTGLDNLAAFARSAFDGGVDIVQLRDKQVEAADELAALSVIAREARAAGGLVAANDRADVAALAGVDVLHVGQNDLTPAQVRRTVPNAVVGLSTHTPDQLAAAISNPEVDYFCVGPVWATPTKPGRTGVGLDLVRRAAESGTDKPWFAIGGIDHGTVAEVVAAGATRIVVVRAITEAADPNASARTLRAHLE